MRTILLLFVVALSSACATAPQRTTTQPSPRPLFSRPDILPRPIGVQWAWAQDGGIVFSPSAHSPNMGGRQATGPEGGDRLVTSISWQSSVKVPNHEVLLHLVASPTGSYLGEEGEIPLISGIHHIGGHDPTMVVREPNFGEKGIRIPAGYVIWVYGEGGGPAHPAPVEVQAMIYMTDVN